MKKLWPKLMAFCLVAASMDAHAQLRFPVSDNELRANLQKVIIDFPKEFSSLKGNVLEENPQTVEYACLLDFKEAEENSITKYNSTKPIYSWQATMLTTEDFSEATKKYKWLFNQLKNMTIKMSDYTFSLTGEYEEPVESKKFSSCILHLLPAAVNLPHLKVEVSLQYYFPSWKVNLLVYEKEREDNEQGPTKETP